MTDVTPPVEEIPIAETTQQAVVNPSPAPDSEEKADEEEFRSGDWEGLPNYKCPHCGFASVGRPGRNESEKGVSGNEEVEWHIINDHPTVGGN